MSATALVLDAVLMLLLVAAIGFGLRLERKLSVLREGQAAFAGAVNDLNQAAARAEAALASLRASGQETDLLHDRIVKARALKGELEALMARRGPVAVQPAAMEAPKPAAPIDPVDGEAAARMAALKARLEMSRNGDRPATPAATPAPVTSLQDAIRALSEARSIGGSSQGGPRRLLDEDLFAA